MGFNSHTWLIVSHGIHALHVAQCEPFLSMPSFTFLWCHVASPLLAMCHPTPHVSKNVKSRPPQNSTKFDVVARFQRRSPFRHPRFRKIPDFYRNYHFALFEKIGIFSGLTDGANPTSNRCGIYFIFQKATNLHLDK